MTAHDVARLLPDVTVLRDLCRSMAVLEAILSPDWESRYHSFDAAWGPGEEMASMRNGSGDEYSIVFSAAGAYIRGFAHESMMSPYGNGGPWPGVLDSVPEVFRHCVTEPAFCDENGMPVVTACLWRETGDDHWRVGEIDYPDGASDPDGAPHLFTRLVDPSPEAFRRFAEDYYEVPVDLEAVQHVYALRPLTQTVVTTLNADLTVKDLADDLAAARYPSAAG
ncbi:hypothetical protein [Planomonospora parontospora]|uniref:hypothetical protein n=1 Tax=Planomonospora parontospora TaxID=58119 RepID=UPI00166F949C|nr:hypothetical protein [Planomonospora parontospora]GGL53176.1 hypothetical protein GCM10014719_63110 [Planomonospora parontospora subsp. antibiotica]GII19516.1 hypothetical protein Ppa05_62420 [Planomonospora parontospora subsp. antibiotica]